MDGCFILSSARFSCFQQCVNNPQHLEFSTPSTLKPLQCCRISSSDTLEHWKHQWDLEMSTKKDQKNPNPQVSTIYLPWNSAAVSCGRTQTDTQFYNKILCVFSILYLFLLVLVRLFIQWIKILFFSHLIHVFFLSALR